MNDCSILALAFPNSVPADLSFNCCTAPVSLGTTGVVVCDASNRITEIHWNEPFALAGTPFPPALAQLSALSKMNLTFLGLTGPIPSEIFTELGPTLTEVLLDGNQITGSLDSQSWGALKRLQLLSIRGNEFDGEIPSDLFNDLIELQYLFLDSNAFRGTLPDSVWTLLPNLKALSVRNNSFTSLFSESFDSKNTPFGLINLQVFDASLNLLDGSSLPLDFLATSTLLRGLNLAANKMGGPLPRSLFSVDGLKPPVWSALVAADFSSNDFEAKVEWSTLDPGLWVEANGTPLLNFEGTCVEALKDEKGEGEEWPEGVLFDAVLKEGCGVKVGELTDQGGEVETGVPSETVAWASPPVFSSMVPVPSGQTGVVANGALGGGDGVSMGVSYFVVTLHLLLLTTTTASLSLTILAKTEYGISYTPGFLFFGILISLLSILSWLLHLVLNVSSAAEDKLKGVFKFFRKEKWRFWGGLGGFYLPSLVVWSWMVMYLYMWSTACRLGPEMEYPYFRGEENGCTKVLYNLLSTIATVILLYVKSLSTVSLEIYNAETSGLLSSSMATAGTGRNSLKV
ncbi:hypothetical protein HDV05_007315 [Chytridiales sp. JEL 0842]|nr:hypothetical protein HDV05_007315 [Chytridiales sp. JEL 0842]